MGAKLHYTILKSLLPIVLLLLAGCRRDEVDVSSSLTELGEEPVMVRAAIVEAGVATRAMGPLDGGNEKIHSRTLLFTYPAQPEGKMTSAYCVFDADGYGYIYKDKENTQEPLRWKDIYTGEASYPENAVDAVFLDNLVNYPVQEAVPNLDKPGYFLKTDNFTKLLTGPQDPAKSFTIGYTDTYAYRFRQMIAPVGHEEAEEVDIIWGSISKPTVGKALHFELEHKMSAISFQFYTDDESLKPYLSGQNVKVWMDNVVIWLDNSGQVDYSSTHTAFVRKNGHVFQRVDVYAPLAKVGKGVYLLNDSPLIPQGDEGLYYSTPVWIFPPQDFGNKGTSGWVKLSIRLNNGAVYTGELPETINYWKYDTQNQSWGYVKDQKLKFMKGYHTTFKVKLNSSSGQNEVQFQGVTVNVFGKRMDERPTLTQSGIHGWDDLVTLESAYNTNSSPKNYKLMRYGHYDVEKGKWIFSVWDKIGVPDGTILPQFKDGNFEINPESKDYGIFVGEDEIFVKDLVVPQNR